VVYQSKTNEIFVHFVTPDMLDWERYLVVHYKGNYIFS